MVGVDYVPMHHLTNSLTYIHQWQTYVMSYRRQQSRGLPVIKRVSFYYKCLPRVYQDCCPNVGPSNGVRTLALGIWVSHMERVFCCEELFTLGFHVAMSMVFCAFVRRIIAVMAISMGLGVNLEGDPLTDWDHSIVIYLQFVDRNICQVKNPLLTAGQCLWIQQWEDTIICVPEVRGDSRDSTDIFVHYASIHWTASKYLYVEFCKEKDNIRA